MPPPKPEPVEDELDEPDEAEVEGAFVEVEWPDDAVVELAPPAPLDEVLVGAGPVGEQEQ